MKVTSYEISKKLAEIGFKTDHSYKWFAKGQAIKTGDWIHPVNEDEIINLEAISYIPKESINFPAYDLETILDALPEFLKINGFPHFLNLYKNSVGYGTFSNPDAIIQGRKVDESLANVGGRLLILLHEKGLVSFNNQK